MATFRAPLSFGRLAFFTLLAFAVLLAIPVACGAQAPAPTPAGSALAAMLPGTTTFTDGRWEFYLEGRVGFPTGHLRVLDRPSPGTTFSLSDLGINVSEAFEASGAFWITPRDAVRASFLYEFLRGSSTQNTNSDERKLTP